MRTRRLFKIISPFLILATIYLIGPYPSSPKYSSVLPIVLEESSELERYVALNESKHKLKADNEARIIWVDSTKRKTEYAVVYLHGFSASQKEGDPIHKRFAKEFGCNLYLSRLADHGIDTVESLLNFTVDRFWESSKEALAIGNALGDKVILMSTSSGGTTALMMAARFPDKVHALINLSPNIAINDPAAFLLNNPWGLYIARMVLGGKYNDTESTPEEAKYWNGIYRIESLVQLEELLETSMNKETFQNVKQPSLTLYYYKNEAEQDPQVKVSAMLDMHKELGTPDSLKVEKAIPNSGAHVIGGSLRSKDVERVYAEMKEFAQQKLHMSMNAIAEKQ